MFTTELLSKVKPWKHTYQKMNGKMSYIYTEHTYLEIKMKERMSFASTCQDIAEIHTWKELRHRERENQLGVPKMRSIREGNPAGVWNDQKTEALLTIATTWKQPYHSRVDQENAAHVYYSPTKKKRNMSFAASRTTDPQIVILSKIR